MIRKFTVAAIVATLALSATANAYLNAGTNLTGHINQSLSSKDTQVGQTFTVSNVNSSNHDINGATIYGHVSHVQRAGQGTNAKIELDVDKVNTRSGNIYKITGNVTNVQVNTKSNAGKEVGGGAAGALIGGLIGGGVGAVLGGSGGFLLAKNSRENVTIPQGSLVTVHVDSSKRVK